MEKDLISIIIPVYNIEKYLARCIDSVVSQTYKNIQIILVDDGSTDKSGDICDKYQKKDNRIIVVHKKNKGLSDARNTGIKMAQGQFIGFVDGDDYIEKTMYEQLYYCFEKEDIQLAVCNFNYISDSKKYKMGTTGNLDIKQKNDALKMLFKGNKFGNFAWNKLYKKDLFKNIEFPVGKYYEDIFIMHKIYHKCTNIAFLDKCLYNYDTKEISIVNSATVKSYIDFLDAIDSQIEYTKDDECRKILLEKLINRIAKSQKIIFDKNISESKREELKLTCTKLLNKYEKNIESHYSNKLKTQSIKNIPIVYYYYYNLRSRIRTGSNPFFKKISALYIRNKNK